MSKIALLSYGYLTCDPRILTIADSLAGEGWEVVCINVYPLRLNNTTDSLLFEKHNCHNVIPGPFSSLIKRVISKIVSCVNVNAFESIDNDLMYFNSARLFVKKAVEDIKFQKLVKDVDVFYSCEMFFGGFLAYYSARKYKKPFVFDLKELHSDMSDNQTNQLKNFINKYESKFIKKAIFLPCVSKKIIDYYRKTYSDNAKKYIYLPNTPSINPRAMNELQTTPLKQRKIIKFVMLSGFSPEIRGIELLIKIWDEVNPKNATLDLYLSNLSHTNKLILLDLASKTSCNSLFIHTPIKEDDIIDCLVNYDVGVIPYLPHICLNHLYCCPGKFGQYLKSGLMVISSDTKNITNDIEMFKLGRVYPTGEFNRSCQIFQNVIDNPLLIEEAKEKAYKYFCNNYNWELFAHALTKELGAIKKKKELNKKRVLLIHFADIKEINSIPKTVFHSIEAFEKYSKHHINNTSFKSIKDHDFNDYDCVIVHFYAQIYSNFSKDIIKKFRHYNGRKIFFAQDDYDHILMNRKKYLQCRINMLYSPVTDKKVLDFIYPPQNFKDIKIKNYLTGYCESSGIPRQLKDIDDREIDIFYRGNDVGYAYGNLGQEKYQIGISLKEKLSNNDFNLDIECTIKQQLYGDEYYKRMGNSRTTLLTESGSSIIFDTNRLMQVRLKLIQLFRTSSCEYDLDMLKKKHPDFFSLEGKYTVSTISPKAFEAILCKTAIIGFEGDYSNILIPNKHYIPLNKDYSNLYEVVQKIKDKDYLNELTNTAYNDIVSSDRYSYLRFIEDVDASVDT